MIDSDEQGVQREMPKYKCHKEVWAIKISGITDMFGKDCILPSEKGYGPIPVSREYMEKHKPQAGGYYVVYSDGYKSYSPADAFESGYTLIK